MRGGEVDEQPWTSPPKCLWVLALLHEEGVVVQLLTTHGDDPS
jgi:hypothetical protein